MMIRPYNLIAAKALTTVGVACAPIRVEFSVNVFPDLEYDTDCFSLESE